METIEGDASGVGAVSQVGGIDAQAGQPLRLAGDAPLPSGVSERFLTVAVPGRGWHHMVMGGDGHLAADDPVQCAALAARFRQAIGGVDPWTPTCQPG